jgi:hypothetical protein
MTESSFFLTVKSTFAPKKIAPPYSVESQLVNIQSTIAAPPYIPSAEKEIKVLERKRNENQVTQI